MQMKSRVVKFLIYFVSIPVFAVAGYIASMIIYSVIVPDPCRYHVIGDDETSLLFKFFIQKREQVVTIPEPQQFNLVFSTSAGALLGVFVSGLVVKRIFRKDNAKTVRVFDKFE